MKSLSSGIMLLALIGCGNDRKGNDTEKKLESQNPAAMPATPANPASGVTPTVEPTDNIPFLGSWSICSEFAQDETSVGFEAPVRRQRINTQFDANGNLTRTFSFYTDKSCTNQVTEADIKNYIEKLEAIGIEIEDADDLYAFSQSIEQTATFSIVADLGFGQFQYNATLPDGVTIFSTLQLTADTLTLAYECDQDDVDSGFCEKVTGDSAQNRAVIDSKATTLTKLK
ncbi:MAG TPA: hypothetical protein VE954_42015 [Oligoflexus sp.]|uniref:hypothetical protein n=1 Tax=Oligoflexus sp. TaxID=1971216 RepID=UPI002D6305F3|nr:hypothetical protein [Oligoflexus sp.]HYX39716.1 hypothetical protein [Oligoflexus sp.]